MSKHGYEAGRLNLPFVGLCSFGKFPYQPDWDSIDADFAILGAPFDFGTQFRAGARFGPRGIREASTLFSFGHAGAFDHEDDVTYLEAKKFVLLILVMLILCTLIRRKATLISKLAFKIKNKEEWLNY